jgi:hypothetical protein
MYLISDVTLNDATMMRVSANAGMKDTRSQSHADSQYAGIDTWAGEEGTRLKVERMEQEYQLLLAHSTHPAD